MSAESSSPKNSFTPEEADLRLTAEGWFRRRGAGLSPSERQELELWLSSDPRHTRAFARLDPKRSALDWPVAAGATEAILAGLEVRKRRRRIRRGVYQSMAVAALIVVGFAFWPRNRLTPAVPQGVQAELKVLKPTTQTLPDGSIIELKEGARFTTDFTDTMRRITLTRGTAHFNVAKNPLRPFIVSAGKVAVKAVGTAFSVEYGTQDVTVLVTEGRVSVAATESSTTDNSGAAAEPVAFVDAGAGVIVSPSENRVQKIAVSDAGDELTWRIPRLEFSGVALGNVAQTMNRYNKVKLVLKDSALEKLQVSGALRADKLNALVAMLEAEFHLGVNRPDASTVELRAAR